MTRSVDEQVSRRVVSDRAGRRGWLGRLRHRGWQVGRKQAARLMTAGLVGVDGRRNVSAPIMMLYRTDPKELGT